MKTYQLCLVLPKTEGKSSVESNACHYLTLHSCQGGTFGTRHSALMDIIFQLCLIFDTCKSTQSSQLPEHQIDPSWKRPMDGAVENPSSLSREELVSSRSHETRPLVTSTAGPWLPLPKRTAPGPTTTTKRWCFVSPTIGAGSVCAQC